MGTVSVLATTIYIGGWLQKKKDPQFGFGHYTSKLLTIKYM